MNIKHTFSNIIKQFTTLEMVPSFNTANALWKHLAHTVSAKIINSKLFCYYFIFNKYINNTTYEVEERSENTSSAFST